MRISDSIFRMPTRSVTYVTSSISMSSLFANLTDFVGCSYIAHPYFVVQFNPAMVISLPVSTRALIWYFQYLTSMHVLTCLLRTGRTSLGLCALYEGDCIWPFLLRMSAKDSPWQSVQSCYSVGKYIDTVVLRSGTKQVLRSGTKQVLQSLT